MANKQQHKSWNPIHDSHNPNSRKTERRRVRALTDREIREIERYPFMPYRALYKRMGIRVDEISQSAFYQKVKKIRSNKVNENV